ncbi:MAG: hypothetical protein C4525_08895 [Desulfarculus sp.]|jgi:hypothetical protein|nr:MAG: hypothetical protein C4525_08895 [Desulfarculus sp.]
MERPQAAELFERVRREFDRRGLLRRVLRLNLAGRTYSVRCDADCFSLYRINEKPHLPPGLPGWTVCRLGLDECFSLDQQETACPEPASPQALEQAAAWVQAVVALLDQAAGQQP